MPQLKPFIVALDPGVITGFALWRREKNDWNWSEGWDVELVNPVNDRKGKWNAEQFRVSIAGMRSGCVMFIGKNGNWKRGWPSRNGRA